MAKRFRSEKTWDQGPTLPGQAVNRYSSRKRFAKTSCLKSDKLSLQRQVDIPNGAAPRLRPLREKNRKAWIALRGSHSLMIRGVPRGRHSRRPDGYNICGRQLWYCRAASPRLQSPAARYASPAPVNRQGRTRAAPSQRALSLPGRARPKAIIR